MRSTGEMETKREEETARHRFYVFLQEEHFNELTAKRRQTTKRAKREREEHESVALIRESQSDFWRFFILLLLLLLFVSFPGWSTTTSGVHTAQILSFSCDLWQRAQKNSEHPFVCSSLRNQVPLFCKPIANVTFLLSPAKLSFRVFLSVEKGWTSCDLVVLSRTEVDRLADYWGKEPFYTCSVIDFLRLNKKESFTFIRRKKARWGSLRR